MKCCNLFLQERSGLPNTARVAAFGYQDHVQTLPWPPFSPKCLVLNGPEDMLHNMFIRGSHNHWPLHSWKIFSSRKKVILQQQIQKVVQSTQRGWLFASCPQNTIPSMKHIDWYILMETHFWKSEWKKKFFICCFQLFFVFLIQFIFLY